MPEPIGNLQGRTAPPNVVVDPTRIEWAGYGFVAFFAVPFFVFNILPVLFGGYVAFTEWGIIGVPRWVGLKNFQHVLADDGVWNAFRNVLAYGLIIEIGRASCRERV